MPLFVCVRCHSIDNTAISPRALSDQICTACVTGHWHNQFPRRIYDPKTDGPLTGTPYFGGRLLSTGRLPERPDITTTIATGDKHKE